MQFSSIIYTISALVIFAMQPVYGITNVNHIKSQLNSLNKQTSELHSEIEALSASDKEQLKQLDKKLININSTIQNLRITMRGPLTQRFDQVFSKELTVALDQSQQLRKLVQQLSQSGEEEWSQTHQNLLKNSLQLNEKLSEIQRSFEAEYSPAQKTKK